MDNWRELIVDEIGIAVGAAFSSPVSRGPTDEEKGGLRGQAQAMAEDWLRERIGFTLFPAGSPELSLLEAHRHSAEPAVSIVEAYAAIAWALLRIAQYRDEADGHPLTWSRLADQVVAGYVVQHVNCLSAATLLALKGLHVQALAVIRQLIDITLRLVVLASDRKLFDKWYFAGNAGANFDRELYDAERREQWEDRFKPVRAFRTLRDVATGLLGPGAKKDVDSLRSYYNFLCSYVHSDDDAWRDSLYPLKEIGLAPEDLVYHADAADARWSPTAEFPTVMRELVWETWFFWELIPRVTMGRSRDPMGALLAGAVNGPTEDELGFAFALTGLHNVVVCEGAISTLLRNHLHE